MIKHHQAGLIPFILAVQLIISVTFIFDKLLQLLVK